MYVACRGDLDGDKGSRQGDGPGGQLIPGRRGEAVEKTAPEVQEVWSPLVGTRAAAADEHVIVVVEGMFTAGAGRGGEHAGAMGVVEAGRGCQCARADSGDPFDGVGMGGVDEVTAIDEGDGE